MTEWPVAYGEPIKPSNRLTDDQSQFVLVGGSGLEVPLKAALSPIEIGLNQPLRAVENSFKKSQAERLGYCVFALHGSHKTDMGW